METEVEIIDNETGDTLQHFSRSGFVHIPQVDTAYAISRQNSDGQYYDAVFDVLSVKTEYVTTDDRCFVEIVVAE